MIQIDDERRAAQAKYEVELALLAGTGWQLLAGEKLIATLMPGAYELSVEWGKLIFAWWDDERAQSWRVTACEVRTAEVRLQATRGLGKEVVEYILRDAERWQPPIPLDLSARRQRYGEWLPQLISTLPGAACVGRVSLRGQRAHGQPGCYARAVLKLRGETVSRDSVVRKEAVVRIVLGTDSPNAAADEREWSEDTATDFFESALRRICHVRS